MATTKEIIRWLAFGDISKTWMHGVMFLFWLALGIWDYTHPATLHRTEWLMFATFAVTVQGGHFMKRLAEDKP